MKPWLVVALLFGIAAPPARAQEEAPPEEDELTPAQAMELLEDAHRMMGKAEELLNDSSRGKALETEKALLERLQRELKDEPGEMQKRILEKVGKLVEKAEKKEKDAAEKLNEIIKKAKSSSGNPSKSGQKDQSKQSKTNKQPGSPAPEPYNPNRADEPSKFKSAATQSGAWGNLPPDVRRAMLAASKEDVPPEFQELWKKYFESLEKAGR